MDRFLRCKLTWSGARARGDIHSFEEPLLGFAVDKQSFEQSYGPLLETLDGGDLVSWVDGFFQPSPLNAGHWEFIDASVRQDFVEAAEEMGLSASLQEVCEGESAADKARRRRQELQRRKARAPPLREQQLRKQLGDARAAADRVRRRLSAPTGAEQLLQAKLERCEARLGQLEAELQQLEKSEILAPCHKTSLQQDKAETI